MKSTFLGLSILLLFYDCVTALIIPEELPTILSLIYSNIPPIKKGTDSRVGVGFRLGEHADFQILVEVGPQKETEPIGNVDTKRRRMATFGAAMRGELGPWAQSVAKYQAELKIQKELQRIRQLQDKIAKTKLESGEKIDNKKLASNDWLTKWSKGEDPSAEDKISSTKLVPLQTLTLNVNNDKRAVPNSGTLQSRRDDLQKLLKPQPVR